MQYNICHKVVRGRSFKKPTVLSSKTGVEAIFYSLSIKAVYVLTADQKTIVEVICYSVSIKAIYVLTADRMKPTLIVVGEGRTVAGTDL